MKITINTEVLKKQHLTMGDFLVMLIGYYGINYKETLDKLIRDGTLEKNVFNPYDMVLSNNTKNLVAGILLESNEKANSLGIDFEALAEKLQGIYPDGMKPGTSYYWRGDTTTIAMKLRALVAKHGFTFTEEEAVKATKGYVDSFKGKDLKQMSLLATFILKTKRQPDGNEVDSMFMTIIENNR